MRRVKVIVAVLERRVSQVRAAEMLDLSDRQVRRLVRSVRREGDRGVIHKLRGRSSNRRLSDRVKQRVLRLYRSRYHDFGPTLAKEKLEERDRIQISSETLRGWLLEAGLWARHRKRSVHRMWRERKECFGEMIQMDGSHHAWLEERGPRMVLMGYIDDATGEAYGRFYDHEGTLPAMESFKRYTCRYGLPISVYVDCHTTYKSAKKLTVWEELEGTRPLSQFERALHELGVEVKHAHSPQAKGRVERLFGVLQDRLVKEMRLRGIRTLAQANAFLDSYWPRYNRKFRVSPRNPINAHVRVAHSDLDRYLCIKSERTVAKDHTLAHHGRLFQLQGTITTRTVWVHEHTDGSLKIIAQGKNIAYRQITDFTPKRRSHQRSIPSSWIATSNHYSSL